MVKPDGKHEEIEVVTVEAPAEISVSVTADITQPAADVGEPGSDKQQATHRLLHLLARVKVLEDEARVDTLSAQRDVARRTPRRAGGSVR